MGRSSKKKKKHGGRRTQSKDHNSIAADSSEILAEELTALSAIFQEDCEVVSESPPQINIKLRPYSKDTGYEEHDISAVLSVRCLQGYPYKCPKLQIVPEKGLLKADADNLLSLLYDQANSNAREGRVMIYNLVEAAQEFLSEIFPQRIPSELVLSCGPDKSPQLSQKDSTISGGTICSFGEAFVCSHVDLFSGSGESWHWNLGMDESSKTVLSHTFEGLKQGNLDMNKQVKKHMESVVVENNKPSTLHEHALNLGALEEESEEETESADLSTSDLNEKGSSGNMKDIFVGGNLTKTEYDNLDDELSDSLCSEPVAHDQPTQIAERDMLMAHLLRIACAPKGPLSDALPGITSELLDLGIVSEDVRDLAIKPSSSFDEIFDRVFRKHIISSKNAPFWKTASHYGAQNSSTLSSRYLGDFEELQPLGHGGFGHVVLCKNKLDGRQYAVKKIRLKDKSLPVNDRILSMLRLG